MFTVAPNADVLERRFKGMSAASPSFLHPLALNTDVLKRLFKGMSAATP